MADACEPVITPSSALTREEICENATILDEGIRLCPLCRSEVRLFFINFNEKILMCENVECEYPFGHENVMYVKEDNEIQWDEEVSSIQSKTTKSSLSATMSMISTSSWSEIDKMNRVCDAEEQLAQKLESREYYSHKKREASNEKEENEKEILKEVAAIQKLNVELLQKEGGKPHIKNEKWIKKLMSLQKTSGMALLNPEEIKLAKQQQEIGLGELKIDIDLSSGNSMSSIKIEISNSNNKTLEKVDNT